MARQSWLGPSRWGEPTIMKFSRLFSTHEYNSSKKSFSKSGRHINKNIILLLKNVIQNVVLELNESFEPQTSQNLYWVQRSHIIRHCCWNLRSWLAQIPRALVPRFLELNCDWLRISMSQKSFLGSGSQTLFSEKPSNSQKYDCVRRLDKTRQGKSSWQWVNVLLLGVVEKHLFGCWVLMLLLTNWLTSWLTN